MKKLFDSILAMGILGGGAVGILLMVAILSGLFALIPAIIIFPVLYYGLPVFGVMYPVTFIQCWFGCFVLRFIGGLINGTKANYNS